MMPGMTDMNGTAPGIELQGLVKSFKTPHGTVEAVRGIDISIRAGEIVALLGPNGAGKSTTIDMLLGLAQPDAGSVSVLGRSPADATLAGLVGAMLQTGMLIADLSARELIAMVASLYPAPLDVDDVLALVGIEAIAGRRTQKLSGGEAQRVRFALALVSDPALLVLDEPTTAMDVEGRHAFWAHDARVRLARPHDPVRHALPRGGRRQRRPRGPDGRRPRRGRRPDDGDPGDGRRPHDPRDAARRRRSSSSRTCPA